MWSLFETIERFLKTADMCRKASIDKSRWLLTIDFFIEISMQESIFYI